MEPLKRKTLEKRVVFFHFGCDVSGSMFILNFLKGVLIGDGFCLFGWEAEITSFWVLAASSSTGSFSEILRCMCSISYRYSSRDHLNLLTC